MHKIWLIAQREYLYNFKRRSFLFTAFGVPAFTIFMMFIIFGVAENSATATGQLGNIGYVDQPGVLTAAVDKPEEFIAFDDEAAARQAFDNDEIGAYFVLAEDFFNVGEVDAFAHEGVPDGIASQFEDFVHANLVQMMPADVPLDRIQEPLNMTAVDLSTGSEMSGPNAFIGRLMVPFVFAFVFLMAINTTSQFLMSGVVEEKENRMMEVLLTSTTPLQMLSGKVLGLGLLGLTQVGLWAVASGLVLSTQGASELLSGISITPDMLLLVLVYLILGYFLFASVMAGIGASVTADQEGRQYAGIFTMVAVIPFMALVTFMQDPNGTIPVLLSLFPLTAPISMLMRMPMTTVPVWQLGLSLALLAASAVFTIWFAAKVFRLGLLMYGKRLGVRDIFNAIRQGRGMLTSASSPQEGA